MKLGWAEIISAGVLTLFLSGCAGGPFSQPVSQAGCHVVRGGRSPQGLWINFPLGSPNDKSSLGNAARFIRPIPG